MLGVADHHRDVPRDPEANLRWRQKLLHYVTKHKGDGPKELIRRKCRDDLLFYINALIVQVNPNPWAGRHVETGPFCTYPFQEHALLYGDGTPTSHGMLEAIVERRPVVVEKSREIGFSWLFLMLSDWLCRFHKRKTVYLLSRSEEAVDSHEKGSLFPKLRLFHKYLPDWLSAPVVDKKLYMGYPGTDSEIAGSAATQAAKVGGRATVMFFDEFSRFAEQRRGADYLVLRATDDVSRCRVFVSTHTEIGTAFHKLTEREDWWKIVAHWSQHPVKGAGLYRHNPDSESPDKIDRLDPSYEYPKDFAFVTDGRPTGGPFPGLRSPWYDRECQDRSDSRAIAINLDLDVKGATKQFFDVFLIKRVKDYDCKDPFWEGDPHCDPATGGLLKAVRRPGGFLRLWIDLDAEGNPPPGKYVLGNDISWGAGATPSCICILDALTGTQVGEYGRADVKPWEFAVVASALGGWFRSKDGRRAFLIWEASGVGGHFKQKLAEFGWRYPDVFCRTNESTDPPTVIVDNPGWHSSPALKSMLLSNMMSAMDKGRLQVRSHRVADECLVFKHDGQGGVAHPRELAAVEDDPSGAREAHADYGMTAALAWRGVQELGLGERALSPPPPPPPTPFTLRGRLALARLERREDWY